MRFKPGQSGKPGGRSKAVAEVRELARQQTARAIEVLAAIMEDEDVDPRARVAACNALLDRGHGKPTQAVDLSGTLAMPTSVEIITPMTRRG